MVALRAGPHPGPRGRRPAGPPRAASAAAPPFAAYTHPDAALTAFDLLPVLAPGVLASQWSSADPAGLNNDGSPDNVLYRSGTASVVFDAAGPGVVEDMWVAADSLTAMGNIVITIDGAAAPAVDMPAAAFFSGTHAPFLFPLVGDAAASSGGNYSYVPIPFLHSCVIAFTGTTAYWHVAYRRLPAGTQIRPFSASENLGPAAAAWSAAGQQEAGGLRIRGGTTDIPAGATVPLATLSGPAAIEAIRLTVPAAAEPAAPALTEPGIAFTGTSTFTLRIDPSNTGVTLVRRLDYAVAGQVAQVDVGGQPAGAFDSPGSTNGPYFWRNASVALPASLTRGRDSIQVSVTAAAPFTAFTYWAYSTVAGQAVRTDTLRMTAASEAAHAFRVQHVLWQRTLTSSAVPPGLAQSQSILNGLRLEIRFDGQSAPAVDAPLGLFFGSGAGAGPVRALMFSVDPRTGTLAAYWPMPFARQAAVTLVNAGGTPVPGVAFDIATGPDPTAAAALASGAEGYFHATYGSAHPTAAGAGYALLSAPGTGKLVGIAMAMSTPPGQPYGLDNLQGNAMIWLDGNRSPQYLGTGTEDFFQGGWYFENGPFTLPTQGSPVQWVGPDYAANIAAYRLFLSDAVPFYNGIRAWIQVGPTDNLQADYASVAFWYGVPAPTLTRADGFAPADPAAAAAHAFTAQGARTVGPASGLFAGRGAAGPGGPGAGPVTASGVAAAVSSFTATIPAGNDGLVLRAQLDQCPGHQAARVYVDGVDVGVWSDPAGNCAQIWDDANFPVPPAVTRGRNSVQIRLVAVPGPGAPPGATPVWTAFAYSVFAFTAPA